MGSFTPAVQGFSGCGAQALRFPVAGGIPVPRPGIKLTSLALQGRFFTLPYQRNLWTHVFNCLVYMPRNGISGSYGSISSSGCPRQLYHLIFPLAVNDSSSFSIFFSFVLYNLFYLHFQANFQISLLISATKTFWIL